MGESPTSVDSPSSSSEVEKFGITDGALFVGDDLRVDLWVKPAGGEPQSIMIRSIDKAGVINSTFLHVEGDQVRRIPTFGSGIELSSETKVDAAPKQISWNSGAANSSTAKREKRILIKRSFEIAGVAVVAAIVAMMAFGAIQLRTVLTGSMIPAIYPGDIVVAAAPQWNTPEIGKVAIYHARDLEGRAVTSWAHRIIGGDATNGFTMKGDANATPDIGNPKIPDIEGVVLFTIPRVGHYLNPFTIGLLVVGITLITWVKRRW